MIVKNGPPAPPLKSVRGVMLGMLILALLAVPVASTAKPEGPPEKPDAKTAPPKEPASTEPQGIPCTITLGDGTQIEGHIVRIGEDRVVVRRSRAMDVTSEVESSEAVQTMDDEPAMVWELDLSECMKVAILNSTARAKKYVKVDLGDDQIATVLIPSDSKLSLWDARTAVEKLVRDVEVTYWVLWLNHKELEAAEAGREAALEVWRRQNEQSLKHQDARGAAQAKAQYFAFRSQANDARSELLKTESRLRYLLGFGVDGRLIRPSDEPDVTERQPDLKKSQLQALSGRTELMRHRERVKELEGELTNIRPRLTGEALRKTHLLMAREKALLHDVELEVSHQVADAVRDIARDYRAVQSKRNARIAAQEEVDALQAQRARGQITLDLYLDALRRDTETDVKFHDAAAQYMLSIARLHERKGSLLERHGISIVHED